MFGLFLFIVFGCVVGWLTASFRDGGGRLGYVGSVIVGVIGSLATGIFFSLFGRMIVGEGPDAILPLVASPVGALVFILVAGLIKK